MSQSVKKSLSETIIQTFVGTITGFILCYIVFPLFGIFTNAGTIAGITITFMFIGLVKNYIIRRIFNYLHTSDSIRWFQKKQKKHQSLFESATQTIIGTIVSFSLSIVIYPMFELEVPTLKIGGITLVFTITSIFKNYLVRRYFENINN